MLVRYISLREMRYDTNSIPHPEGTYRTAGISRTKYISQILFRIYIAETVRSKRTTVSTWLVLGNISQGTISDVL